MNSLNRRTFIKGTVASAASIGLAPVLGGKLFAQRAPQKAPAVARFSDPNEEIRVAVVGFHGRGADHIKEIDRLRRDGEKVRIVALCDVDRHVLDKGVENFEKESEKVEVYTDIRKLLEKGDFDAVTIATPNHWHALASIWAMQAGKDVYVEKPVSHNVSEGRRMVEAARKYNRIVQTGTQSRSSSGIKEAVAWVKEGNLGKIQVARGLCYKPRGSIGKTSGPQAVPDYIDYDLWCGPAPLDPPRRSTGFGPIHYDWHWFWAYGAGDLGNQGIHQMDIARWFLGATELSPRVFSVGGRLGYEDDGETPNTQIVYHDYAKAPLIFEVRGLPEKTESKNMDKYKGGSVAVIIECEGGHVFVPNYNSASAIDKEGKEIQKFTGASSHFANFFKAMRSRKMTDLNADILEGHLSSALCHTGNISYRLGAQKSPDEIKEAIKADKDALPTFERMAEHLAANGVDLEKTRATLGVVLKMDPKNETFPGNAKANALLTRQYRKPFVVPAKV